MNMNDYFSLLFIKHKNQIKIGGKKILFIKSINLLKKSYKIFYYISAFLIFFFQIILSPLILIRIGRLRNDKFGHITLEIENYLNEIEKKINCPKKKFVDFFYKDSFISNNYYIKMRARNVKILPTFFFKELFEINLFFNTKFICGPYNSDRDIFNLLDTTKPKIIFTKKEEEIGKKFLESIGVKNNKYVCLIVRDKSYFGYKPMSDYRNADINNFIKAVSYLNSKEIFVIRMGAKKCPEIRYNHKNFFDYANSGLRTELLDIYLGSKCIFSLGTSTGFDGIPISSRKPAVITNYVPLGYFPSWTSKQLVIFKHHINSKTKKKINMKSIIENGLSLNLDGKEFEHKGVELEENNENEILDVTIEMHERLNKTWIDKNNEKALYKKFLEIFPSQIVDRGNKKLHGKILSKIGYYFLSKNQYFLEEK